jgi:hypothetical protein
VNAYFCCKDSVHTSVIGYATTSEINGRKARVMVVTTQNWEQKKIEETDVCIAFMHRELGNF